jgi:hypothetical protein
MANAVFSYPNYSDVSDQVTPILSGGSWNSSFPLTNLQDAVLSKVARSTNATAASTKFNVDLVSPRGISRVIIPSHNLSSSATARVRATNQPAWSSVSLSAAASLGASSLSVSSGATITSGDTFTLPGDSTVYSATATLAGSGMLSISPNLVVGQSSGAVLTARCGDFTTPVWDSGTFDVWPVITTWGALPWGSSGLWYGKLSPEDRDSYPIPLRATANSIVARYLLIEISDTGNADGYIELSRLFVSRGIQPTRNFTFGAQLGWLDNSQVKQSLGGANFYDERTKQRTAQLAIEHLPEDESLGLFFDMMLKLGRTKQIFIELDPDDTFHLHRRSFLCTLETLQPIEYTSHARQRVLFQFKEVTA